MTQHFECSAVGWQHTLSADWGPCRRMIEVAEDQWASRQIDRYKNGQVLKYSRAHERDAHGQLIGLRFSKKDKWTAHFKEVQLLSLSDFDRAWNEAVSTVDQGADADPPSR